MTDMTDDALAAKMTADAYEHYWSAPLTLDRHLDAIEAIYAQMTGKTPVSAPRTTEPSLAPV